MHVQLIEEKSFYFTKIKECGKNQNQFFKLTRNLMVCNSTVNLPQFTSTEPLAKKFNNFFMRKTPTIRN